MTDGNDHLLSCEGQHSSRHVGTIAAVLLRGRFALEVQIEEFQNRPIAGALVLFLAEAMTFIVKDDVFDRCSVRLRRFDHFVRFDFENAWIVGALQDDQRAFDSACMEQG